MTGGTTTIRDLGARPRERSLRGRRRAGRPSPRAAGFSLIEVLIVVVILALMVGGTTVAIGAITRTKLRAACMKVVSASRFAYNRAAVRGGTVRVVLDMEGATIGIEEAPGHVTLARIDDVRREEADEEGQDAAAVDPWEAARQRLNEAMRPSLGASPFGPILDDQGEALEQYAPRPLGDGVRIVKIITPHEAEPREGGRGSFYFFPGGIGEHVVVQLADANDTIYSVEVHPLTGRGKVHSFPFEPEDLPDPDEDEVRDPG